MASSTCKLSSTKIQRRKNIELPPRPKVVEADKVPHLTLTEQSVLDTIAKGGTPISDVALILGRSGGSVTDNIHRLVRLGMVYLFRIPGARARLVVKTGDKPKLLTAGINKSMMRILSAMNSGWNTGLDIATTVGFDRTHVRETLRLAAADKTVQVKIGHRRTLYYRLTPKGRRVLLDLKAREEYDPNQKDNLW